MDVTSFDYNPFKHRNVFKPTNDFETFAHLVKGCLGTGILAMPLAFFNGGLWFGLFATIAVGIIMTYGVHILVKSSHFLCRYYMVPSMLYAEIANTAFDHGPRCSNKLVTNPGLIIDTLLSLDLLGTCCVYIVFIAANVKQVADAYLDSDVNIRIFMLVLFPFLLVLCQIRNLKYLAPFSMLANILITISLIICCYYVLNDIPNISERPAIADLTTIPTFFGTVIFSLAGIAVVMHLENDMKNPEHFIGCYSVLNFSMAFVVIIYCITGFLGYLKYGNDTLASITLNLPQDEILAQFVKILMSISIFLTFSLQFYVPVKIFRNNMRRHFEDHEVLSERIMRFLLTVFCHLIAVAIPSIGSLISLIGAVFLSLLALIIPALIDIITFWNEPYFALRFIIDTFLIIFGVIALITGTYTSVLDIIQSYK